MILTRLPKPLPSTRVTIQSNRLSDLASTCPASLLVEVTVLLSTFSSSSWPLLLPPFLRRLDWHCTSVRRPRENKQNKVFYMVKAHLILYECRDVPYTQPAFQQRDTSSVGSLGTFSSCTCPSHSYHHSYSNTQPF